MTAAVLARSPLGERALLWFRRQPLAPWLYLLPALGSLVVWTYWPLGYAEIGRAHV